MKKIAVILSGCGYLDGSEIREAVAVLWALSRHKEVEVQCFAPDMEQADHVDHLSGQPIKERRNVLIESARIARGKLRPLSQLVPEAYDALIMPGGYGAAKNLTTFATSGSTAGILPEVRNVIRSMFADSKPIGAACIAPAVVALALSDHDLDLTVGARSDSSDEIEKLGHRHFVVATDEIVVDRHNRIVTTPAYMYNDAPLDEVFEGIRKMVDEVISLIGHEVVRERIVEVEEA